MPIDWKKLLSLAVAALIGAATGYLCRRWGICP
jgi:uncharacterized membrane protein YfcA